jgi:mannose/cellobiose epimerase-like protein (N-acyl-D-glucosamine 2-epimerase family)
MNPASKIFSTAAVFLFLTAGLFSGEFNAGNAIEKLESARDAALKFWSRPEVIEPDGGFHIWFNARAEKVPEPDRWGDPMAESLRMYYTLSTAYSLCRDPQEKARIKEMLDHGMRYLVNRRKAGNGLLPNKEKHDTIRRCLRQVNAVNMISDAAIITGDRSAAEFARSLFDELHRCYHDREFGGYFDRLPGEHPRTRYKRLETQLLAAAALTSLCQLFPDQGYREKLQEIFDVLTLKQMYHSSGAPYEWLNRDFSRKEFKGYDDELQYGHAAEAGWIICEAAEVLGISDGRVKEQLAVLAETLLRDGADENGGARMSGTYSKGVTPGEFIPHWWNNLELMNFSLWYYKVSQDRRFLDFYFKLGNYSFKNYPLSDGTWSHASTSSKIPLYRGGVMCKSGWHLTHAVRLQKRLLEMILPGKSDQTVK